MLPVMTGAAVPPETGRPSSVNIQALGLTVVLTCSTGTGTDHATQSALWTDTPIDRRIGMPLNALTCEAQQARIGQLCSYLQAVFARFR